MFRAIGVLVLTGSLCPLNANVQAQVHHAAAGALPFNNPIAQSNLYNNEPVLQYNNPLNQANLYNNSPVLRFNNPLVPSSLDNHDPGLYYNNPLNQVGVGNSGFNNPLNQGGFGTPGFNNNNNDYANANGVGAGYTENRSIPGRGGRGQTGPRLSQASRDSSADMALNLANVYNRANAFSSGAVGAGVNGEIFPLLGGGVMAVGGGFGMNPALVGGWGGNGLNNAGGFGGWNGGGFNNGIPLNNLIGNGFGGLFGPINGGQNNPGPTALIGNAKSDPKATSVLKGTSKSAKRTSKSSKSKNARRR